MSLCLHALTVVMPECMLTFSQTVLSLCNTQLDHNSVTEPNLESLRLGDNSIEKPGIKNLYRFSYWCVSPWYIKCGL